MSEIRSVVLITDAPLYLDRRATRTVSVLRKLDLKVTVIDQGLDPAESKRTGDELDCCVLSSPYPQGKVKKLFWSACNRLLPIYSACKRGEWLARQLEKIRPDIIHLVNIFSLQAVAEYSLKKSIPFIYEVYEYWPEHLFSHEYRLPKQLAKHLYAIEQRYLSCASVLISVSPLICSWYEERGAKKSICILNTPDSKFYDSPLSSLEVGQPLSLVHSGHLAKNRNVGIVIESIGGLSCVSLTILGKGREFASLTRKVKRSDLKNEIIFSPPVEINELREVLGQFDIGVSALLPNSKQADAALPNKLFDYINAGLAVVAFKTSALTSLEGIEDFAVLVEPQTIEALTATIQDLAGRPEKVLKMKRAAREVAKKYNSAAQEGLLCEVYL